MQLTLNRFITFSVVMVTLLSGCQTMGDLDDGSGEDIRINYEALYDCIWAVTDCPDETTSMPNLMTGSDKAVYFRKGSDLMYIFRQCEAPEGGEETEAGKVYYRILAECSYTIDSTGNVLAVSGDEIDCYFRVDRLNERNLTLYFQNQANEYLAYSRCDPSLIAIIK